MKKLSIEEQVRLIQLIVHNNPDYPRYIVTKARGRYKNPKYEGE